MKITDVVKKTIDGDAITYEHFPALQTLYISSVNGVVSPSLISPTLADCVRRTNEFLGSNLIPYQNVQKGLAGESLFYRTAVDHSVIKTVVFSKVLIAPKNIFGL